MTPRDDLPAQTFMTRFFPTNSFFCSIFHGLQTQHHHHNNNNNNNSSSSNNNNNNNKNNNQSHTISLPWIPGLSPKLKKVYRKAGYNVVFKSNKNLQIQLTTKNKTRHPKNSLPDIYRVPCSCGIVPYIGETKMKVSTRKVQHQECLRKRT